MASQASGETPIAAHMGVAYASANPISSPAAMMMTAVDADKEQKLREQAAGADRSLDRLHARAGHARARDAVDHRIRPQHARRARGARRTTGSGATRMFKRTLTAASLVAALGTAAPLPAVAQHGGGHGGGWGGGWHGGWGHGGGWGWHGGGIGPGAAVALG